VWAVKEFWSVLETGWSAGGPWANNAQAPAAAAQNNVVAVLMSLSGYQLNLPTSRPVRSGAAGDAAPIYPNSDVRTPPQLRSCGASGFPELGAFKKVRFKMLKDSARIWTEMLSGIRDQGGAAVAMCKNGASQRGAQAKMEASLGGILPSFLAWKLPPSDAIQDVAESLPFLVQKANY
jgi:hypothetical protein